MKFEIKSDCDIDEFSLFSTSSFFFSIDWRLSWLMKSSRRISRLIIDFYQMMIANLMRPASKHQMTQKSLGNVATWSFEVVNGRARTGFRVFAQPNVVWRKETAVTWSWNVFLLPSSHASHRSSLRIVRESSSGQQIIIESLRNSMFALFTLQDTVISISGWVREHLAICSTAETL